MRSNGRNIYEDRINASIKSNKRIKNKTVVRCLLNYFASILTHGVNSDITKDNLTIIADVRGILNEEKNLLLYLNGILDDVNESALNSLLERLRVIHTKTMSYYSKYISEIEMSHRGDTIKLDKDFLPITETDSYRRDALSLNCSLDDIVTWLDYPDDFIKYIKGRITIQPLPSNFDEDYSNYTSVLRLNHGEKLADMRLFLPEIVDFNSTLRVIDLLEEAYGLYVKINNKDDELIDSVTLKKSYTENLDNKGLYTFGSR